MKADRLVGIIMTLLDKQRVSAQALADTFTRIGLLPVKVDVRSATWSLDKQ